MAELTAQQKADLAAAQRMANADPTGTRGNYLPLGIHEVKNLRIQYGESKKEAGTMLFINEMEVCKTISSGNRSGMLTKDELALGLTLEADGHGQDRACVPLERCVTIWKNTGPAGKMFDGNCAQLFIAAKGSINAEIKAVKKVLAEAQAKDPNSKESEAWGSYLGDIESQYDFSDDPSGVVTLHLDKPTSREPGEMLAMFGETQCFRGVRLRAIVTRIKSGKGNVINTVAFEAVPESVFYKELTAPEA